VGAGIFGGGASTNRIDYLLKVKMIKISLVISLSSLQKYYLNNNIN
jgi:hypothetical protein